MYHAPIIFFFRDPSLRSASSKFRPRPMAGLCVFFLPLGLCSPPVLLITEVAWRVDWMLTCPLVCVMFAYDIWTQSFNVYEYIMCIMCMIECLCMLYVYAWMCIVICICVSGVVDHTCFESHDSRRWVPIACWLWPSLWLWLWFWAVSSCQACSRPFANLALPRAPSCVPLRFACQYIVVSRERNWPINTVQYHF